MKKLLLIASSLAFSVLLVEVALRVAGVSYPVFNIIDPDRGFAMAPGAEGWQAREGRAYIKINSDDPRIVQLVKEARRVLSIWPSAADDAPRAPDARDNVPPGLEDGLDHAIYTPPPNAHWAEAWRVTEGLILTMAEDIREKGADFWIVTLSNGIQVHPDPRVREAFMAWKGIDSLSYPDRRIAGLAERNGIHAIALVEPLADYALEHNAYLHGFRLNPGSGHWNDIGHGVAGKEIAAQMCRRPSRALLSR